MNKQEAIKYLEQHKYFDTCGQKSLEESNKVIDMAIEALQEPTREWTIQNCPKCGKFVLKDWIVCPYCGANMRSDNK